jgi:hypothetical protein
VDPSDIYVLGAFKIECKRSMNSTLLAMRRVQTKETKETKTI